MGQSRESKPMRGANPTHIFAGQMLDELKRIGIGPHCHP